MSFSEYGTIAEVFSAFAIIITLGYGIIQIRINNRLARAELTHRTGTGLLEFYLLLGKDAPAARIWRDGVTGAKPLQPDERTQFTLLCTSAFIGFESQFRLQNEKLLTRDFFDRGDLQMKYMMSQPGIQKWWPRHRINFSTEFAMQMDIYLEMAETPAVKVTETATPQMSS